MDSQSLEGFEPVFGAAEGALEEESIPCALLPFVFYLHSTISACDRRRNRLLRLQVTDFHSNTWQIIQTTDLLDDLVCNTSFLFFFIFPCVSQFFVSNEINVLSGFLSYYYFIVFFPVFFSFYKAMFLLRSLHATTRCLCFVFLSCQLLLVHFLCFSHILNIFPVSIS